MKTFRSVFKNKVARKALWILLIPLVFGAFYLFDFFRARNFSIELIGRTSEAAVAGDEDVTFTVRLTRGGKPVKGHNLVAIAERGNLFASYRETTDENGEAVFTYYTVKFMITEKGDELVTLIHVMDENNSLFVEVNAKLTFEQKLIRG